MKPYEILKKFRKVSLWKTIYFNLHYLPFKTALHIPIYIYRHTELYRTGGRIVIDAPIKTGMIKFGEPCSGLLDSKYARAMWEVSNDATIVFRGNAHIGKGSKICVGDKALLTFGDNFSVKGNSEIICKKQITFGNGCMLSWDILMMDTDFHHIYNNEGVVINHPKPITIGDNVWIGCRNTILKGVTIASGCIVSANSTITKSIDEPGCIIGGHGRNTEILKRGITWG